MKNSFLFSILILSFLFPFYLLGNVRVIDQHNSGGDDHYEKTPSHHLWNNPTDVLPTSSFPPPAFWQWTDLFSTPNYFQEGSSVINASIGLRSNLNLEQKSAELNQIDVASMVPALNLFYERQIWNNIGGGISLGAQTWSVPVLNYRYNYLTVGLRASYHFKIIDRLDPYIAVGTTFRLVQLSNLNKRRISKNKINANFVFGARYYFSDKWGAMLELGGDSVSWLKTGLSFYIQ